MMILRSAPKMGYFLVEHEQKYYFVFDLYDKPSLLHMHEIDAEDKETVIRHTGDGLSLSQKFVEKYPFDKVIDRTDFEDRQIFTFVTR